MSIREIAMVEPRTGTAAPSGPPPAESPTAAPAAPDSSTATSPPPPPPSSSSSSPSSPPSSNAAILDIGSFVSKYNKMVDTLYPLELMSSAVLYVIRWENYPLTLVTLISLCILFYYPALLAGSLVGVSIVGMALGKYYTQTRLSMFLRRRESPPVEYLNEDYQALKRCKKDQKVAHKLLLEYGRIVCKIEATISMVTKALEYVYKVVLWKSMEVSLCVTVLLCVLLTLLCTVYLRVLSASFPLIVLCLNRYFIKRTVEIWKYLLSYLYGKVRLKTRIGKDNNKLSGGKEEVHHEVLPQDRPTGAVNPELQHGHQGLEQQTVAAARGTAQAPVANGGDAIDREGGNSLLHYKGFCTKCNTSFAKLLKRKHDCNYCGQSFCGSCTVKVKRAVLGATSPAAFEESVRVCQHCKHLLDELKLDDNSIPAS